MPDEPFPQTNNAAGFGGRIEQYFAETGRKAIRNVSLLTAGVIGVAGMLCWRLAPQHVDSALKNLQGLANYIKS